MRCGPSLLFLMVFSSFLPGCAVIPNLGKAPEPKKIESFETQKSFDHIASRTWPTAQWWEAYGDKQLNQLMNEALQNAPSLAEADARSRQAEAVAQQTEAALYPHIQAEGSYKKMRQTYYQGFPPASIPHGYNDLASASLDMSFQLDFFGKNHALLAAATSTAEAARLEKEQARLMVSTSVASAYADLAQLYADLDAGTDALAVRTKSDELLQQRFSKGLENTGALEQEHASRAAVEAEIEGIKEALDLAKIRLAALIGAGPDRALTIERPDIKNLTAFGLPENLPAELLGRRPDIIAAKLQAEASNDRVDAAEASFYPNVNLIGYVGHQALGLQYFTSPQALMAALGPTISLPILDGGALRGQYRQARAAYDNSVAVYNETLLRALHDVASVVTSEKSLKPRLEKTQEAVDAAEKAFDVANNRYKGGLATYLVVLHAEDALISSRRALADLKARAFTLDVALTRALGGGFTNTKEISE